MVNPWLAVGTNAGPSRKRQHGISANSSAADKSVQNLKKTAVGRDREGREEDGRVEITLDPDILLFGHSSATRDRQHTNGAGDDDGDGHAGESDGDGDRMATMPRKRVRFGQRDLVAEAFAGGNVVQVSESSSSLFCAC